jgi:hypothetical protein
MVTTLLLPHLKYPKQAQHLKTIMVIRTIAAAVDDAGFDESGDDGDDVDDSVKSK